MGRLLQLNFFYLETASIFIINELFNGISIEYWNKLWIFMDTNDLCVLSIHINGRAIVSVCTASDLTDKNTSLAFKYNGLD